VGVADGGGAVTLLEWACDFCARRGGGLSCMPLGAVASALFARSWARSCGPLPWRPVCGCSDGGDGDGGHALKNLHKNGLAGSS